MDVISLLNTSKEQVNSMLNLSVKSMLNLNYNKWDQVQGKIGALHRFNIDLAQASWKLVAEYDIMKLKIEGSCKYEVLSGNLYAWALRTKEL